MGKTYNNPVNKYEVALGIERLLIADYPQAWTPARVDIDTPPTGFYDLGAVVEDTPVFTYSREYFELETGLPRVTQYRAVQMVEGVMAVSLHSNSWKKLQYALGNFTYTGSYSSEAVSDYAPATRKITLTGTTSVESITANMMVTLVGTAGSPNDPAAFVTKVTSVTVDNTNDAGEVYVADTLPTAVSSEFQGGAGTVNYQVAPGYSKLVYGGSSIREYALLGVIDFIDGTQVVQYIPKASPNADVTEEYRPEQNSRIPLSFKAYGTVSVVGSCDQVTVGERYEFPSVSSC